MTALRDKYAIVGTGKSRLGQVGANSLALLEEAIKNALVEAGLTNKDIDGVVVRGADDIYSHHQMVAARLGVDASFSTSLDNGGASQILSIILAVMAIEAGLATTVVCAEMAELRPFRRSVAACVRRASPHVRIRHDPRRLRPDRHGVPRACAAQSGSRDEETDDD